jgi:hypothetical protein
MVALIEAAAWFTIQAKQSSVQDFNTVSIRSIDRIDVRY